MSDERNIDEPSSDSRPVLVEGVDYYFDGGLMVLTEHFLSNRGYCCGNGCRHCPYEGGAKLK
ncbi:MAG: hypothetical protein K1X36_00035 [Pyrinomonadaceae bacterium]|nr:hypothetical protein [Pyrinomonadaceae bacterium]